MVKGEGAKLPLGAVFIGGKGLCLVYAVILLDLHTMVSILLWWVLLM